MNTTSRNCVRCGKELTDAASQEAGTGPICRGLDNALLAQTIPSNIGAAREHLDVVDLTMAAPETLKTLNEVCEAILSPDALVRTDWRVEVKRLEWTLSFGANDFMRGDLTKLVAALGYVGLATLWNGEAATGKATVTCMNGRIVLQGPRNKAARNAFRAIPGVRFHTEGSLTPKAAWSFPASALDAAFLAIVSHYPNNEGLAAAVEAAKEFNATVATVTPAAPKAAPKSTCCLTPVGVLLKVMTPYNPHFIADLKKIPYNDRRWNQTEKVWEVPLARETDVKALVMKHYGQDALQ